MKHEHIENEISHLRLDYMRLWQREDEIGKEMLDDEHILIDCHAPNLTLNALQRRLFRMDKGGFGTHPEFKGRFTLVGFVFCEHKEKPDGSKSSEFKERRHLPEEGWTHHWAEFLGDS